MRLVMPLDASSQAVWQVLIPSICYVHPHVCIIDRILAQRIHSEDTNILNLQKYAKSSTSVVVEMVPAARLTFAQASRRLVLRI